jgi:hypothetical protein
MSRSAWIRTLLVAIAVVLIAASTSQATSIPIRGASTYGQSPSTFGTTSGSFLDGSFVEETICPSNDSDGTGGCNLAYVYTFFNFTPPVGATTFTIDFSTATAASSLGLLYCDATTTVPCGTLSGSAISGSLGPDSGSGQEFTFTNLSQLQNQKIALIFVDGVKTPFLDANGDPVPVNPVVPDFSVTWGTGAVATPEPASMLLVAAGLAVFRRKLRRA